MKLVSVYDAVGLTLCHDLTRVIPGIFKGRAFKRGHIIRKEDIPLLLDMGKEHIYVIDGVDMVHEEDAALRMARAAAGEGLTLSEPVEGKVSLTAAQSGLLKVNVRALLQINSIEQVIFSTLHTNQLVARDEIVAGTKIVQLFIDEDKVQAAERLARFFYPVITVKQLIQMNIGLVITGNEIYHGRISDGFGPVVQNKIEALGSRIVRQIVVGDDQNMIAWAIKSLQEEGAEMIMITGGMSVDPDDQTPTGVYAAGGEIICHGAPVLPGAMFMLAYLEEVPVLGLPACVMHAATTVFDLILPRLLAGERLEKEDIAEMGHGGLCSCCSECYFPGCGFGK